jgi:hypothetical protein
VATVAVVPEPSSLSMLAIASAATLGLAIRRLRGR